MPHQPIKPGTAVITDEEAGALARSVVNLSKVWNLADAEARILLGGMPSDSWKQWKEGDFGGFDADLRKRMAHLIGIHAGLRRLFEQPARGYAWIRKPNSAFGGRSALDLMLRGATSDLSVIRVWLDAECEVDAAPALSVI